MREVKKEKKACSYLVKISVSFKIQGSRERVPSVSESGRDKNTALRNTRQLEVNFYCQVNRGLLYFLFVTTWAFYLDVTGSRNFKRRCIITEFER